MTGIRFDCVISVRLADKTVTKFDKLCLPKVKKPIHVA